MSAPVRDAPTRPGADRSSADRGDRARAAAPRAGAPDREQHARTAISEARAAGGHALPGPFAQALAPTHGDLADVRLHVGPASARAAAQLEARAFTIGRDIHFAAGAYQPGTATGLALLDHELTHAAQPLAPRTAGTAPLAATPWLARDHSAAEREADRTAARPGRPQAQREAEIHRFPERGGLTEHEVVPPPWLMQVFGDRFLLALEIAEQLTGTSGPERAAKIAVQVQGTADITGTTLVGRELRIPIGSVRRPVNASIVRLRENEVALDLHGDGMVIAILHLRVRVEERNQGYVHHLDVIDGQGAPLGSARVAFPLPPLPANVSGAAGGTAASATLTLGGDDIVFIARRLESGLTLTAAPPGGGLDLEHPARWMHYRLAPTGTTTLTPTQSGNGDIWLDLDGDTHADLRLAHRMADWAGRGQTGRQHWFDAYDRDGVRLRDGTRTGNRGRIIAVDAPDREPRPPIPESQRYRPTDTPDPGVFEALSQIEGDERRMPGAAPQPVRRRDGTVELRVDADGDRRAELALLFRPRPECNTDGTQDVDLHFLQLSSHASAMVTFTMTPEQFAALVPTVAHPSDGSTPVRIDLIQSAYDFETTAPPLALVIEAACEACGMRHHTVRIGSASYDVALPLEARDPTPLARNVSVAAPVGGLWMSEATLTEYGDRFRFVFDRIGNEDFLAIAGLSRDESGRLVVGETRRVRLEPGSTGLQPEHVECDPHELRFLLGTQTVIIRDALTSTLYADPLSVRSHTLTITGTAVPAERRIRYDVQNGRFVQQLSLVPLLDERTLLPQSASDRYFDTLHGAGNILAVDMRNAMDQGSIDAAFYDAVVATQLAMLRLRLAVAASWRGEPDAPIEARSYEALVAIRDTAQAPGAIVLESLADTGIAIIAHQFGNVHDHYADLGAFGHYLETVYEWTRRLGPLTEVNAMDREAAAAVGAVDTLVERGRPDASVAGLVMQYDAAIAAEIVTAHRNGLIGDVLYTAWDRMRRNMPSLVGLAGTEENVGACEPDGGRIEATDADAQTIDLEITAAVQALTDAASPSLADAQTAAEGISGAAQGLAVAVRTHDWPTVFAQYDALMRGLDRWTSYLIRTRYGDTSTEYRQNQHLHHMREEIVALQHRPEVRPIAATFAPDSDYDGINGGIRSIPLTIIVYREGGSWHLHDLTPERPYLASQPDLGEVEPPHALFEDLNDNDRFPKGILYYQIPGGRGDRIRCTAPKDWHEWVRDFGLVLAAIGLGLVTAGTGTVAVIGGYFLAGAAVANAVAAGGELHESVVTGQATTTSVLLNIFDIIASLAGAGALVSGTIARTAATASRAGMAWTGAAARVAAFSGKVYIPLTATSMAGDIATVAVMSVQAKDQLDQLARSGATDEQIASARQGLLIQLAITGGLVAMSVRGDLPEIRAGNNPIVLDVVGDVAIARAAGVRVGGVDLHLPPDAVAPHAVARWHAEDIARGRVSIGDDTDGFHDWHRRWLEMDSRVTFRPDGGYEVNLPRGPAGELPPDSVQQRLRDLAGPESDLIRNERGFALADDVRAIEAQGAGLRVDPLDARWPDTRRDLLARLGNTPEAEGMIRRFEQARLGALGGNADVYVAQRRHANQVIPDHEMQRISAMFPGHEVYIRGGLADTATDIDTGVSRIEIEVVVPAGTSADQMAAIEQRGQLLHVRPDPGFLQENALLPERTLAVDVRVSTADGFVGRALTGPPMLRIDSPLATRGVELSAVLDRHLAARGMAEGVPPFRVMVLSDDDFARQFGSERQGRAVFRMDGDTPVIYARANATPADMLDEASHLVQLRDPDMARRIRMLDETSFHDWAAASVQHRLEMFQTKLEVEIDAKHSTIRALEAETPVPRAEVEETTRQLRDLEALQQQIAGITPRQLSLLNAGAIPMPSYLEHPPWMFGRLASTTGVPMNRFAVDPHAPRTAVPDVGPEASTLTRTRGSRVEMIGAPWTERTLVFSDVDGTVTAITPVSGGETVITVTRTGTGATFTYRLERGATLDVSVGTPVTPGLRLGEDARDYRLVEAIDGSGRRSMREEIRRLPPDTGWGPRGRDSTFRGTVMERAALDQLEAGATFRMARGEISGVARIPHTRGGGGFDHVYVEFTGSGATMQARIRIIEVKDYPGRSVPLEEFTAIHGTGLEANFNVLRDDVAAAHAALHAGEPLPSTWGGPTDPDQINALQRAVANQRGGAISVEVMVGPGTRIGAEGHHASTVMPALRRDVEATFGSGSFVTNAEGAPTEILQSYADAATAAEVAARAPTGTGP